MQQMERSCLPIIAPTPQNAEPSPRAEQPPAILSWKGLVVGVRSLNKVLLKGVSGQITTGYWAIMG